MARANYHALAAVHHEAKANVYARAGLREKARSHKSRAAWHASFGAGYDDADVVEGFPMWKHRHQPFDVHDAVDSPLEYEGDLDRDELEWDPDTADPTSEKYDPHSEYSRMLAEVRVSGAFAPSGQVGSRGNPIDLEPEDATVVQAEQRRGYAARAQRAQVGYAARNELKAQVRDMYERRMRGENANYARLHPPNAYQPNPNYLGYIIGNDVREGYTAGLVRGIERKVHRDRRARGDFKNVQGAPESPHRAPASR
jgi:hypothetical protein